MGNDPLEALKPLLAPPAIAGWPPAPGWWVLAVLLLIALLAAVVWGWRRWRHHCGTRYQREALALLDNIDNVAGIAALLRRVAISAYGRDHAATTPWQELCAGMDANTLQLLQESQYRADSSTTAETTNRLREQARRWITGLPAVER